MSTFTGAIYSGLEGSLWLREDGVLKKMAGVKSWTFTANQAVLDTTVLGDTDRTIIDGVRSFSGSCSLFYYNQEATEDGSDSGAALMMRKIIKPLNKVDPNFNQNAPGKSKGNTNTRSGRTLFRLVADKNLQALTDANSSTAKYLWLDAWITSFNMTMAVGEVLSCDVTFEVNGTPYINEFSSYENSDFGG